jgi:hypothetical protein
MSALTRVATFSSATSECFCVLVKQKKKKKEKEKGNEIKIVI